MYNCDGCNRRRQSIYDNWEFGVFFWNVLANVLATFIVGIPLVAYVMGHARKLG